MKDRKLGTANTFMKECVLFEIIVEEGGILVARAIDRFPTLTHLQALAEYEERLELAARPGVSDSEY